MSQILFAKDKISSNKLATDTREGKLKRLYQGIYSADLLTPASQLIEKNWMHIIPFIIPNGIVSFRSAIDLRPIPYINGEQIFFITSTYNKTIKLPGLIIKVIKGDNQNFTEPVTPDLLRSNEARALLENLTSVRSLQGIKTIGKDGVELRLAKILYNRSEIGLNKIRDEAREVSLRLNLHKEFNILSAITNSLLSTQRDNMTLTTSYAKSVVRREPYDMHRRTLFNNLNIYLQRCDFVERKYEYDKTSFRNLSFFESYFSNYIEGTKFKIDEAEDIVFAGKSIANRHADSHNVLANYRISNDYLDISKSPNTAYEFIEILQARHASLMSERPDISPGNFKTINNMAGNTYFVDHKNVMGTLIMAFDLYSSLKDGMHKALFMHFILTEIHPFNDGNGRISRIMLNSELVKNQNFKIIIPTVYRDSYLGALRAVSRDEYFRSYCKMMDVAQAYTASVPWNDYAEARGKIENDRAEKDAIDLPIFNRALQKLYLTQFPSD